MPTTCSAEIAMADPFDAVLPGIKDIKIAPNDGSTNACRNRRFELLPFAKIELPTDPSYLVWGLVPRDGLTIVWGPPKSGKSFWMFDLAMHVALGWKYRGRRVVQGPVIYVACEGGRGFKKRVVAFRQEYRLSENDRTPPFYLVGTRLDLISEHEVLIKDIRDQLNGAKPVAVVIDTLNRSLIGDENGPKDMGAYIAAADAVRETFGCAVILIHHCGIDSTRLRGHTSLPGAADAQIAVKRENDGVISATVEFMKDGADGDLLASKLKVVDLGEDGDGNEITSCVVEPVDDYQSHEIKEKAKLGAKSRNAYEIIADLISREGKTAPAEHGDHIPSDVRVIGKPRVREYLEQRGNLENRQQFHNRMMALKDHRKLGEYKGLIWLTSKTLAMSAPVSSDES